MMLRHTIANIHTNNAYTNAVLQILQISSPLEALRPLCTFHKVKQQGNSDDPLESKVLCFIPSFLPKTTPNTRVQIIAEASQDGPRSRSHT